MWLPIIFGSVFCLFGGFELTIFIINKKYYNTTTEGTVVEVEKKTVQGKGGPFTEYLPTFSYIVNDRTYKGKFIPAMHNEHNYKIGQKDVVKYSSKKPEHFIVENGKSAYLLYIAIILAGVTIIVLASIGTININIFSK